MRPLFILSLCVLIAACKKTKDDTQAYKNALYTFTNHLNQPITVKIFPDSSGLHGAVPTYLHIAPGRKGVVPTGVFYQTGSIPTRLQYYWTTDDMMLSNWGIQPLSKFNYDPALPVRNFDIYGADGDGRMHLFLKHIDTLITRWKMIDAFDEAGNSVWSTVDMKTRDYQIEMNNFIENGRFIIGTDTKYGLYGKAFRGRIDNKAGYYSLISTEFIDNGMDSLKPICLTNNYTPAKLVSNTPDRTFLIIDNKPPYYLMAKQ